MGATSSERMCEMRVLPAEVERHRFDAEEYHRMLEVGLLSEDDRVELIGGEIVDMTPIGWRHVQCINRLTMLLASFAAERSYAVSVQNPIGIGPRDEPQPDLALLQERPGGRLPAPEDTLLVIEVSDTSLTYDRDIKLPLYAGAGIPEVWILDLRERKVEVYAEPSPDGYRISRSASSGEQVRSETVEGLSLSVNEVLS
jgi:Uma2 family endonuclease